MRTYLLAAMAAVALLAAGVTGALGQLSVDGKNRWMTVKNASELTAHNIYVIPSTSDCCWSRDLLPRTVKIEPKYSLSVNFDDGNETCTFDIRVTNTRGTEWNFDRINVCVYSDITLKTAAAQSSNDGKSRWMTVKNDSNLVAYNIYVIPSRSDCCWSHDVLGKGVIFEKKSLPVNFDDGSRACEFDIRVTSVIEGTDWNFDKIYVCGEKVTTLTLK
jgi:hypothetical protein